MKKLCLFLFGLGIACVCGAAAPGLRESINFNRGWKFQLGDVTSASAARFDDSKWDDTNLPHSFSMPYFAADRFYVGYGYYRKLYFESAEASVEQTHQS